MPRDERERSGWTSPYYPPTPPHLTRSWAGITITTHLPNPPYLVLQSSGALSGCSGVTPGTTVHLPVHASDCKGGRVGPHSPGCAPGGYTGACGRERAFGKVSLCSQRVSQDRA